MTVNILSSLISATICFALACFVFSKNHKSAITIMFSLLCAAFSFWSFTQFQIRQAESADRVATWIAMSGFWPITIPLLLHFILEFSKSIRKKIFLYSLYLTYALAGLFSVFNIVSIDFIPSQYTWGWGYETPDSIAYFASKIWAAITAMYSMIILFFCSGKAVNNSLRKQAHYILLGISVVFLASVVTELVMPLLDIHVPDLTHTSFTLMSGFVGWAIWRHRLFSLDSSTAADTIISTMSDALAVVNLDHKIEIVNKSLLRMLDYSESDLIGADLYSIIGNLKHPDTTLTTLLKKDFISDIETTFKKKDGTQIPISLSWSILKENNIFRGFVFIARDMSEREKVKATLQKAHDNLEKRVEERTIELKKSNAQLLHEISVRTVAEQKLAEEKEKLSITLKSIDDGVITVDVHGTVVLINKAACEMIGCSENDAIGVSFDSIYKPVQVNNKAKHEHDIFHEIANNPYLSLYGRQSLLMSTNGKEYIITETGVSIKDADDNISGYVIVFSDITERYQFEEEKFKARKLESISLLASGIAHDFNDLLTGIITNLFMAKMGIDSKAETYIMITTAEKAAFQASILTRQLLTFATNEVINKEETSIKELIENSIGFYLKDSRCEYKLHISESLSKANVDRGQIDRVFNNIILNADQSMPDGGVIFVNAENFTLESINPSLPLTFGSYIKISVTDQGSGIPDEILPKIFDPYFSTRSNGSGLGLTTAYTIVQQHGGHIAVTSQLGVGTTFIIYLPAIEGTDSSESDEDSEESQRKGCKILFIDDEKVVLQSTGQLLTHLGHDVCLAEDYSTALTYFRNAFDNQLPFTIVIMDLTISSKPGPKEIISEFIAIDPQIKVIISSGYVNDPMMVNYSTYGFAAAMPKPYNAKELNQKILDLLSAEQNKLR
jgi:PAS domain S-box-containing protein